MHQYSCSVPSNSQVREVFTMITKECSKNKYVFFSLKADGISDRKTSSICYKAAAKGNKQGISMGYISKVLSVGFLRVNSLVLIIHV